MRYEPGQSTANATPRFVIISEYPSMKLVVVVVASPMLALPVCCLFSLLLSTHCTLLVSNEFVYASRRSANSQLGLTTTFWESEARL